jgi:hypothetical protein
MFAYHMGRRDLEAALAEAQRLRAGDDGGAGHGHRALAMAHFAIGRFAAGFAELDSGAAWFSQRGKTVPAAACGYETARQAAFLGRRDVAEVAARAVADSGTHYAAPAQVLLQILTQDLARAETLLLSAPRMTDAHGLSVWLAYLAGHDAKVGDAFARTVDSTVGLASMYFAGAAAKRQRDPARARSILQRLVDHPDAWREPVLTRSAWFELARLLEADDRESAVAAYQAYLDRSSDLFDDQASRVARQRIQDLRASP